MRRVAVCPRYRGFAPRRASSTVPAQTRSAPVARKRANIGGVQLDGSTKRWYKKTQVVALPEGGWEVLLDDRSINTPKNNELRIPTEALAYAIAQEWEAQSTLLNPKDYMPLTALAITAVDVTPGGRDNTIGDMIRHFPSDTVLDLSDPPHTPLHGKKEKVFCNIHRLFNFHFNVALAVTEKALIVAEQKPYTMKRLEEMLKSLDNWELTGTYDIASFTRSTILGLSVHSGFLNAAQALEAARLEEEDQIERSGAATAFLSLLRIK